MARGYTSLHPVTRDLLKEFGVPSSDVTQGYGSATASAGYHEASGTIDGKYYSDCVDLRYKAEYLNRNFFNLMAEAGIVMFPRNWSGNQHIHCVQIGLVDTEGRCNILQGPRMQLMDAFKGRNGLVGHAYMEPAYRLSKKQVEKLTLMYNQWAGFSAADVILKGQSIDCFPLLDKYQHKISVELRAFCENPYINIGIVEAGSAGVVVTVNGRQVRREIPFWLAGNFGRVWLRDIAKIAGYNIKTKTVEGLFTADLV